MNGPVRVLDVGSGARPHAAATHLCDALEENLERGQDLRRDSRPFIYAAIENLPYKDNSFAFVYAVHVLEHSKVPEKALAELLRVARGGYIETPTPTAEILYGWPFHKCSVRFSRGRFVFSTKRETQRVLNFHALYAKFPPWKAVHKLLDIVFNILYVRVTFSKEDEVVHYKNLGRRQAFRDLIQHQGIVGAGPRPRVQALRAPGNRN